MGKGMGSWRRGEKGKEGGTFERVSGSTSHMALLAMVVVWVVLYIGEMG